MKIMDRLSRILGGRIEATNDPECSLLDPFEIRLIAGGKLEMLSDFARSSRLHAVDPKGDTPLHIAARRGNLALCDLFIRSGSDAGSLNHDRQTPADVAFAEGQHLVAELLSSLAAEVPEFKQFNQPEIIPVGTNAGLNHSFIAPQEIEPVGTVDDLSDLINFEAENDPEAFFEQSASKHASGTFIAVVSPPPAITNNGDLDWDLSISPAPIAGDGISSGAAVADHGTEHDFLKVRNRGPRSAKRAVLQSGTRLSIDPDICMTWADEARTKGRSSFSDIDGLIALSEGNAELDELRINLQRNMEVAGFYLVGPITDQDDGLWEARSDITSDELVESVEASLSRATRLPGTQRFILDKSDELQLLEPMVRAKQELQLGILGCETAVEMILGILSKIHDGSRDPGSVSLRTILPSRPDHTDTAEVIAAGEMLRSWQTNGRVMDGKRRRQAVAALESLDFSLAFYNELVRALEQDSARQEQASLLGAQISVFEAATEHLIRDHLPYVRRFASRSVEEGEDPEDVFQVAFIGLQRSTRRFDPERGYRFLIYASYWMRQAIIRWRADEGSAIRIPVHRSEKIAKLDRALGALDARADGIVSDNELAAKLEWTLDEVRQFRGIPREAEYPDSIDDWDDLLPERDTEQPFDRAETEWIVADALAELQERQADVIRMRFGIGRDDEMTLEEIGQLYGVTRERIRQIEAKALKYLSHPKRKQRLQALLGM